GVRAAGVEDDGANAAVGQDLLGPNDGRGLHPVRREDRGSDVARAIVDHERDVGITGRLEAGDHARGAETGRRCDAHGATPSIVRPAVSGSPSMMLASCRAWPAAPLPRLSRAQVTRIRPESRSTAACRWALFDPEVAEVRGCRPAGRTWMNGS